MFDLLGLDALSEAVYRTMLEYPSDGVADLARRLDAPPDEIRSALDRLSELPLVQVSADDPQRVFAISPDIGMEILLARQQAELAAAQQRLAACRVAADKLISEFADQNSARDKVGVMRLDGTESVRAYLASINSQVTDELLSLSPGGPQTAANMRASRPLNQRLLERGVRLCTLFLDSIRHDAATVSHARWLTEHGGQVRTVPSLPTRLIISDRRVAIVAMDTEDTALGAFAITIPGVVAALGALFDNYWRSGQTFGAPAEEAPDNLNRQQKAVLELLARGYTDQSVAKRLGVSVRTARRIATDVISHLDARSRFQAGVHAVQMGHLSDSPE
ncbi:helix-turn-helix domain-containing protein [Streptomyces sp. NPDC004270]